MNAMQTLVALWTLVLKEIKRFTRIWPQTLLPPSITMAMYFIIFGSLIGSRIGDMDGFSYMDFIVPGLIMMSVITNSYSNVASSFFSNKFQRSIEEMMVSPMPNGVILSGFIFGRNGSWLGCGADRDAGVAVLHPLNDRASAAHDIGSGADLGAILHRRLYQRAAGE
ncbi:hypothetical protein HAALTHF_47000n [Vreelandella aquamarina]|nr:hypothetical protein HAALTHF_47000n [Halomonas axialensis]